MVNYTWEGTVAPTGYIGVDSDYVEFLDYVDSKKVEITSGESDYTTDLVHDEYEVPDLYSVASGYELYCEDKTVSQTADLAWIYEDGSKLYQIPEENVSEFVAIESELCELIKQGDALKEQIAEMYETYKEQGNQVDYEATRNRTR